MISNGNKINGAKVLIMGATFKENVSDIRNSKVEDVYKELKSFSVDVDIHDPHASYEDLMEEYGYGLIDKIDKKYNAVIVAVNHNEYVDLDEEYFKSILVSNGVFVDVKGIYRDKIKDLTYWSL